MLKLDENRAAVTPKDAATLIITRNEPEFQIFFVRRHAQSAFMGGAVVFPGGKLDDADGKAESVRTTQLYERAAFFASDSVHALALAICGCREAAEEAGILPTQPPLPADAVEELRTHLDSGGDFAEWLVEREVCLDTGGLVPFARWITPRAEQRRYDARFFVAAMPAGQVGRHDARETTLGVWATPKRMLDAFNSGDVFLAPPTLRALELLQTAKTFEDAVAIAAEQSLEPICPELVPGDPIMITLPGDPLHSVDERRVAGPTRFVLRDGKLVSEDP